MLEGVTFFSHWARHWPKRDLIATGAARRCRIWHFSPSLIALGTPPAAVPHAPATPSATAVAPPAAAVTPSAVVILWQKFAPFSALAPAYVQKIVNTDVQRRAQVPTVLSWAFPLPNSDAGNASASITVATPVALSTVPPIAPSPSASTVPHGPATPSAAAVAPPAAVVAPSAVIVP
ncbi:hypothetical protein DL93DRAFT_2174014 [Clavulina sp. PMI_390]|nr:hypothetical protein DL93DRAFT_2174014 [Clavulina sp. PMI_390]